MSILSCGCESDDFGLLAEWVTIAPEGDVLIAYGALCLKHFKEYEARFPEGSFPRMKEDYA